jgi:hypothetical protein
LRRSRFAIDLKSFEIALQSNGYYHAIASRSPEIARGLSTIALHSLYENQLTIALHLL